MNEKIYDLSMLQEMEEAEPGFVKRMIGLFLDSIPPLLADMTNAYIARDLPSLALKAHKIKSSLDIFGMTTLANNARRIEKLSKEKTDDSELGALMNTLTLTLPQVCDDLNNEPF